MAPHVLIIDADSSAAQITGAVVQHIAPEATLAIESTPGRAWPSAQRVVPDVVIVDLALKGTEGIRLIRLCQKLQPAPRIVVLAAAPTPLLRMQAQQLGVDVYLEKPAALALLVERLRAILEQPRERPLSNVHHA